MKILFVWPGITGYMGDCWRELAGRPDVELKVAVDLGEKYFGGAFKADEVMRGLDWSDKLPDDWRPDVVFTVGWRNAMCKEAARRDWNGAKKICCFDLPWRWSLRKIAARAVLRHYLRQFDGAWVPGQAAARYAKWLGFREERIFRGLFGTNLERFGAWRGGAGFLQVGREAREKGVDVLRAAHELYRQRGGAWGLKVVSTSSPDEVARYYAQADAFILASREEPWGVVLAEAAGAGLPIICTNRCGARHEVVADNGFIVRAGKVEELAAAMARMERLDAAKRRAMGEAGRKLAANFSCPAWADRVLAIGAKEVLP
ncbi:MAG: glycosyltransferase family 4 protein [Kiritimatiellae bacterium]|nr:glycosyltransferase family 4 protein [Kiritimatiellia bacterium]